MGMACGPFLEMISARLDGVLSEQEQAQLEEHLAQCPSCRSVARELEGLRAAMSGLEEVPVPPELEERVMNAVHAERRGSRTWNRRRMVRSLAGLAACAVLCVGIYQSGLLQSGLMDQTARNTDGSGTVSSDQSLNATQFTNAGVEPSAADADGTDAADSAGEPEDQIAPYQTGEEKVGTKPRETEGDGLAIGQMAVPASVLTLERLPEGAEDLLPPVEEWGVNDQGQPCCEVSVQVFQTLSQLAQEQGITASTTSVPEENGQSGALCQVVLAAG